MGLTLDSGGAGVYDSPLANDQLGGRSGVKGLEALQVSNIELSIFLALNMLLTNLNIDFPNLMDFNLFVARQRFVFL